MGMKLVGVSKALPLVLKYPRSVRGCWQAMRNARAARTSSTYDLRLSWTSGPGDPSAGRGPSGGGSSAFWFDEVQDTKPSRMRYLKRLVRTGHRADRGGRRRSIHLTRPRGHHQKHPRLPTAISRARPVSSSRRRITVASETHPGGDQRGYCQASQRATASGAGRAGRRAMATAGRLCRTSTPRPARR